MEDFRMKRKIVMILVSLAMASVFAGGASEKNVAVKNYTFGGSSTVAPIIASAIPAFEQGNPSSKISYETLGSSVGIKQLQAGTLSLAGSSRELKDAEIAGGLVPTTIALDGLSVAVNKEVGISNLSLEQLSSIFSGEITNWKDVGGKDAKIELIIRDETSGTYSSFKEIVLDKFKKKQSPVAIVAKENGELAAKIASTPNSIGYVGMAFNHIITASGGKILSIDGVNPSADNVKAGTYPISRSLYMVTIGTLKSGVEKDFVDFLLSAKGQAIVEETGFIALK